MGREENGQAPGEVTAQLGRWRSGETSALETLVPLVYAELRKLARAQISLERTNHTLQPTALVHEVYLRLSAGTAPPAADRGQFYGVAARLMRQILVDHARRYLRAKRGGGAPAPSPSFDLIPGRAIRAEEFLALDQALRKLAQVDERKARAVELRYFTGLQMAEAAGILSVSVMTLHRDLQFATAWLAAELTRPPSGIR
ncbi:MAG: ECF-type sigma factor [Bryobacteraceae bacterium]